MDLDIKMKGKKFQIGLIDENVLFYFPVANIPGNSNNVRPIIDHSTIGAKSLRIARASENPQ